MPTFSSSQIGRSRRTIKLPSYLCNVANVYVPISLLRRQVNGSIGCESDRSTLGSAQLTFQKRLYASEQTVENRTLRGLELEVEDAKLTTYDPSNALVRGLFSIQGRLRLFRVGDTIVDVGCLPGTSSRCFRQWIDESKVTAEDRTYTAAVEEPVAAVISQPISSPNMPKQRASVSNKSDIERLLDEADECEWKPSHWRDQFAKKQNRKRNSNIKSQAPANPPPCCSSNGFIIGIDAFKTPSSDSVSYFVGDVLVCKTVQELSTDPLALEQAANNVLKIGGVRNRDQGKADLVFIDLCPLLEKELNDAAMQLLSSTSEPSGAESPVDSTELLLQQSMSHFHPAKHPQYFTRISQDMVRENQLAAETLKLRQRLRKEEVNAKRVERELREEVVSSSSNALLVTSNDLSLKVFNHKDSEFFDVADNSTAFETFLEMFASRKGLGKGGKGPRKDLKVAPSDLSTSTMIIKKAGSGETFVVKDDSSSAAGSDVGISHRINFYNFPEVINASVDSNLTAFRPTPLSVDTLFLTALESTAAAVRLMKPYLKPFREIEAENPTFAKVKPVRKQNTSKVTGDERTAGKMLIRLIIPSEATLTPSSHTQSRDKDLPVLASTTRDNNNDLATILGSVSGAYYEFIASLQAHFSFVEVVDSRKVETGNVTSLGMPIDRFSTFTQLLVLAHNGDTPLIASEQSCPSRSIRDNPAFMLFDREIILNSETKTKVDESQGAGNRNLRAHSLKYDLPSRGVVMPSGDGLGNNARGSSGQKSKFRGVFKFVSETSSATGVNLSPNASKIKMRHSKWSPNHGFSRQMDRAPSSGTLTAIRDAFKITKADGKLASLGSGRDKFSAFAALTQSTQHRPANLAIVGQGVADASTKGFQSQPQISHSDRKISLGTGTVVSNTRNSNSSSRSIGGARGQFFKSRYPALLQAPPPAEELRMRLRKATKSEVAKEDAQNRFNEYKMKSIDDGHMVRDLNDV